jgi:hypothetical protein
MEGGSGEEGLRPTTHGYAQPFRMSCENHLVVDSL